MTIQTYRCLIPHRRLRSPCTHRLEGVPAPKTPDHFMETNPARIGCRQPIDAEPEHRAIAPLVSHSQEPEICLSNLHPTMHEWVQVQTQAVGAVLPS